MNENHTGVKSVTPQNRTYPKKTSNLKQPQQIQILQVGDRVTAHLFGQPLPATIVEPLIDPADVQSFRGAEFLIVSDKTWRVNLQSDRWLICSPREFVSLAGGGQ